MKRWHLQIWLTSHLGQVHFNTSNLTWSFWLGFINGLLNQVFLVNQMELDIKKIYNLLLLILN
jgi:hypothetical protein